MNAVQEYRSYPHIRTPEDLGIACLGSPNASIVPPKRRIDRSEYGRRLADAEGGIFTQTGYVVPVRKGGRAQ